ncbi:MAG TPA: lactate utilization protein C [Terracidiphilus sp.]|nr:lactate utilization protein C [Terracidiphilus sp.]
MKQPVPSRQRILDRIRAATPSAAKDASQLADAYAALPRAYIRRGSLFAQARVELMIQRLREYDAEVVECTPAELPNAITAQLAASGRHLFVAPSGAPLDWMVTSAWKITGLEWTIDHGLAIDEHEIERAEGVVTAATCGIADSGTIVLHHSATEGRRVLTLLPDWYLCILRASQIVETLPEYFSRCQQPPSLATYISGPSATADIEMTRIKGVHGPRILVVIVVRDN